MYARYGVAGAGRKEDESTLELLNEVGADAKHNLSQ